MGLKNFKPTSPARRYYSVSDFKDITKGAEPHRKLVEHQTRTGGRNHVGRITSRFRGGGHKQRYRIIDWKRNKIGVPALVATIEYDPNRSARIALLHYADGDKSYILAPNGLEVGAEVMSGEKAEVKVGNLEHENISFGKAGRKRWLGRRPHNRGVSMNPVDHPMGGGEGRTSGGR